MNFSSDPQRLLVLTQCTLMGAEIYFAVLWE